MRGHNAILDRLRGESGSVVYRFVKLPLQRLSIALRQLLGGTWVTFYADVVERSYAQHASVNAISEATLALGAVHLDILKRHGLLPNHKLLDFGCGVGRSGLYIARYLEPAHYVGLEISPAKVRLAEELLRARGLSDKRPVFVRTTDVTFDVLAGQTFDYLWSHSVFNHTPDHDIDVFFQNVRKIVRTGSTFVFSYVDCGGTVAMVKRRTFKDWSRSLAWWQALGERHRFSCVSCEEWTDPDDRRQQYGDRRMILTIVWS